MDHAEQASPSRCRRVLITTDAVGGVWSYSLTLAAGFAELGCSCTLAVLGPAPSDGEAGRALAIPGLQLIETGLPLDWTAADAAQVQRAAHALDRIADETGAASVHLHTPVFAAWPWRTKLVAVAHSCVGTWWDAVGIGAIPDDLAWRAVLMRRGLERADTVVAPSRAFADALHRVYGVSRPIHAVHNGSDPPALPARTSERERRVLTAGRLWDPGKNIAVLDDVAERLGAPVDAAGPLEGPDDTRFRSAHLNLLGNLPADAFHAQCRRAAIFAAPSRYEPFGLAVLEAAQLATPLVLADIPSFRELWDGDAVFVPPGDAGAWTDALRALLDAPQERDRMGRRAHARAQCYGAGAMTVQTASLHRAITAPRGSGAAVAMPA